MKDGRTKKEKYNDWVKAVVLTSKKGWRHVSDWNFKAPNKGTVHDLSAADLSRLDIIEERGLMLVEEK